VLGSAQPSSGTLTGTTPTGPLPLGTHTITLTVSDGHGGVASDTVVITVRDVTAPTFGVVPAPMTIEQSTPSGTALTVAMPTAADNCSAAVAVSSDASVVFPPGRTTVSFTAHDGAGNIATATMVMTVVDTVAPILTVASPQARSYLHSDVLTMSFSAADAGSGLAVGMPTGALDGTKVATDQSISLLMLALGTHTLVVSATDVAQNSRSQSVSLTIVATLDSLIASVNQFAGQNKIDDASTLNGLLKKLNDTKQAVERGKKAAAIEKLQEFIDQVNAQQGRHIARDAGQILVADARFVIGTL
jgi:hypothetical protein